MDLDAAYRVLEVEPGAGEDVVREARRTLAKVWHPDRHANDPELQTRAQSKLADVNAAFELVSKAGFPPASKATPKPRPSTTPKSAATPSPSPQSAPSPQRSEPAPSPRSAPSQPSSSTPPRPSPPPAASPSPAASPLRDTPAIEFVPNRRVRWPVILVFAAALGVGAYLAIVRLAASEGNGRGTPSPKDAAVVVDDTAVPVVPDTAVVVVAPDAPAVVRREKTFTLGSTRDDVIAAQGQPGGTSTRSTTINGVHTASSRLTYGESSTIDLDGDDRVVGWAENDAPLHMRIEVRDADVAAKAKARGSFAIGATADEVVGVLGPPTSLARDRWSYGTSVIDFVAGKVAKVTQGEPKLPVP